MMQSLLASVSELALSLGFVGLLLPAFTPPGQGGYHIARSLRFNSADSAILSKTYAAGISGVTQAWLSCWVKRSVFNGLSQSIINASDPMWEYEAIYFNTDDTLTIDHVNSSQTITGRLTTTRKFRDSSAWLHIFYLWDTAQATANNRMRLWFNGVEETSFSERTNPNLNAVLTTWFSTRLHNIGANARTGGHLFSGYMADFQMGHGSAPSVSDFGQFDSATAWVPKTYTGAYGTNGFHLDFFDNSAATAAALGKDSSSNGNNWTPNNFSVATGVGNDSLVDTPTNYGTDTGAGGEVRGNYCTLNPINANFGSSRGTGALSNGNLDWTGTNAVNWTPWIASIGLSSGKFYVEQKITALGGEAYLGLVAEASLAGFNGGTSGLSNNAKGWFKGQGFIANNAGSTSYGTSYANGDVKTLAVDIDAGKGWFGKNGVWDAGGDPATGANPSFTFTPGSDVWYIAVQGFNGASCSINFGQRAYDYAAPSGFKALCTQNLPDPAIKKPLDHFNAVTWGGGTLGAARSITGVGHQPDMVWGKVRASVGLIQVYDAVRGVGKRLQFDTSDQFTNPLNGYISSFDTDGFSTTPGASDNSWWNGSSIVAWSWKKGVTPGFDIQTYAGNGGVQNVPHNLGAVPALMITKCLNVNDANSLWEVYHRSLGAGAVIDMNNSGAQRTGVSTWNSTAPTSSVFTVGNNTSVNAAGRNYVTYLWAEVPGFSRIGHYIGNGSNDGPFVWCGFKPRWAVVKSTSEVLDWWLYDSERDQYNPMNALLRPNLNNVEATQGWPDFVSNGLKVRNTGNNVSGVLYMFWAFAESPFKYARAR